MKTYAVFCHRIKKCVTAATLILLLTACGKSEIPKEQEPLPDFQSSQSIVENTEEWTEKATDSAEARTIKEQLWTEKQFEVFEIRAVKAVPPKLWDTIPFINEVIDIDQTTWKECLEKEPHQQLIFAEIDTKYTPETKILGPQNPDGVWSVWAVTDETGTQVICCRIVDILPNVSDSLSDNPTGKALNLTQDQWTMLGNQVAALTASGIWKDFTSPADWTEKEFFQWLNLRRQDWAILQDSPTGVYDIVVQADFSPKNTIGQTAADLFPKELQKNEKWNFEPLSESAKQFMEKNTTVEYKRQKNEIVAVVQIDAPEQVTMEYTFGIAEGNNGPTGRTYLKHARQIAPKGTVAEQAENFAFCIGNTPKSL